MTIVFNVDTLMTRVRNKMVQQERHIASIPESTETAYAPTLAEALHKLKNHPFTLAKSSQKRYIPGTGSWLRSSQFIYWRVGENGMATKYTEVRA